jgi:DNA-directed RNA polymerase subunit RPC12/RpoP
VLTLLIDISGILMITGISLVLIQDRKLKRNEEAETENQFVKSNIVSPKSVTVIAWLSIILAIIGVIPTILLLKYVGIYLVLIFIIASLVQIILATGMLNGKNWGRVLFLLLTPLSILIDFTTGSASAGTIIKAGYYIIFAYYLTRKPVIEYFKQNINISENNNIEKNEYICSECGADIKEEDKICTKCGAKLDEIEEE